MWVDLTRPLHPGMPVFPGDPEFSARVVAGDGFRITELALGSHTGTHVDAPAHVDPDGPAIDELPLDLFAGEAVVLDVRGATAIERLPDVSGCRIVLLRSGSDETHLTVAAARALREAGVRTVGIDGPSVDAPGTLAVHRVLLGTRDDPGVLVENLTNLAALPGRVEFFAVPLALSGGDGSPVRAFARALGTLRGPGA
ncbi:cyclase family protein [Kineococcus rhizosphaerae]|uniref:Kynurenine formamidase n=1 Tax=Kineococcus rhizosphaerae TaxID=559628 RepID=A0A2T0R083_9ACTN|nr:cyclase family protein [Kineococcus rhizosphaerae]PRY12515.1 kynurenine formamidase [Kineococcus rhizosphaerae]